MLDVSMQILLEEYYQSDITPDRFYPRKRTLEGRSCQICGITQSGKTTLLKSYLSSLKKQRYLYLDCSDERIDAQSISSQLARFCRQKEIEVVALDSYTPAIKLPKASQLIIATDTPYPIEDLKQLWLYPLDYEEFLALEHRLDAGALNHYLQFGGFGFLHKIAPSSRILYMQQKLKLALSEVEFEILRHIARLQALPISAFSIYERLKQKRRISKDSIYKAFSALKSRRYIFEVAKYDHPRAVRKLYLADIYLKSALTIDKHFGRLFENLIFLELFKQGKVCYYLEGVEFYLPSSDEIILCAPFVDKRALFRRVEALEALLFTYNIRKITAVTINEEASIAHPFVSIEVVPFENWALRE